mmetsp:Transcript_43238/g.112209  ORF Transcript_43238/g.112209 Transcript_43238/m.112209 type:complete len:177 (+) Transcript_43238:1490-2020(+)
MEPNTTNRRCDTSGSNAEREFREPPTEEENNTGAIEEELTFETETESISDRRPQTWKEYFQNKYEAVKISFIQWMGWDDDWKANMKRWELVVGLICTFCIYLILSKHVFGFRWIGRTIPFLIFDIIAGGILVACGFAIAFQSNRKRSSLGVFLVENLNQPMSSERKQIQLNESKFN